MIEASLDAICLQLMHSTSLSLGKKTISAPSVNSFDDDNTINYFYLKFLYTHTFPIRLRKPCLLHIKPRFNLFPFSQMINRYQSLKPSHIYSLIFISSLPRSISSCYFWLQWKILFMAWHLHKAQPIQLGECVTVDRWSSLNNFIHSLSH